MCVNSNSPFVPLSETLFYPSVKLGISSSVLFLCSLSKLDGEFVVLNCYINNHLTLKASMVRYGGSCL